MTDVSLFWHKDSKRQSDPQLLVDKQFLHVKTSNLYIVREAMFDASCDEWSVKYERSDPKARKAFPFCRPLSNFLDGRFIEVK